MATFITKMNLTILVLPLLSAMLSTNRKCGSLGGPVQSAIFMVITTIQGTLVWIEVGQGGSPVSIQLVDWIVSNNLLNVEWVQVFDSLTAAMQIPVLYISAQVQIYSQGYMESDLHKSRFFSYLSLFTFFMLIQITAENQLVLFVGWEGVGQASYLLINFWYVRIAANMAAQKAFLLNRVGDWSQTLGIILTLSIIGDVSFSSLQSMGWQINSDLVFSLSILFLIGASAKSAQFGTGIHGWLASAMEGPTPVSGLIHAATMVTAGVYLQMRQSPQQEWSSDSLLQVTWQGSMSAIQGAACGVQENDLKRVIAYSTTSQQGYMVIACGQSQYHLGLFHLINHAFFKAQLFLSAGAVIHAVADQQDMRKMGGLILFIPFSYAGILQGSQSLMAFPFMTGFYSKDLILEQTLIPKNFTRSIAYIFAIMAAFLSAIYSVRLLIQTFLSKPHFPYSQLANKNGNLIQDPNQFMMIPQITLSLGAAYFGHIAHSSFQSEGSSLYLDALFTHPNNIGFLDGSMLTSKFAFDTSLLQPQKYLPLLTLFILILVLPLSFSTKRSSIKKQSNNKLIQNRELINVGLVVNHSNVLNHYIMISVLKSGNYIQRQIDRGFVELIGPQGQIRLTHYLSFRVELMSSGSLRTYGFYILSVSIFCISIWGGQI